ncbi:MAG: GNAT family N-acetyltransferase [Solirubrobacteraceae bacterium]
MEIAVADNPDAARYEITVDGERSGFVTYRLSPGVIAFLHAEVDPDRERRGLGHRLVRGALDDARARGLAVRPVCPFVAWFVETHSSEYADLVV